MSGLAIATFPKQRAVLPGESTLVDTVVENRSALAVEFDNSDGPSPFAYELLVEKDRTVRYKVSQLRRDRRRTLDIPPERVFPRESISPNHNIHRDEDLAEFHNEDFLPGKYLIRTIFPPSGPSEMVSPLSPITILVPKIESFSSEVCGNRQVLVTAYAHRREDGGVLILQREAYIDPRENVAFRRLQLEPGSRVQVAIAVDAVNAGNGRWFGWLRDGKFEAAAGWGNRLVSRAKPIQMGGAETILLSPGFQVDVGVGLFGFVEILNGAATFRAARTTGQGITPAFQVELTSTGQGLRGLHWNYRPETGITVFWQDGAGQIYRRSYDIQGKPLDAAPVRISGMTPLAWSATPLGEAGVQMVVRSPDGRYFFRASDRGTLQPPVELPPFAGAIQPAQEPSFAFCPMAAAGKTKVVMAASGKIWSATVDESGSSSFTQAAEASQPLFLHAFSPRGRTCWVEWFEKDVGLRRAPLP